MALDTEDTASPPGPARPYPTMYVSEPMWRGDEPWGSGHEISAVPAEGGADIILGNSSASLKTRHSVYLLRVRGDTVETTQVVGCRYSETLGTSVAILNDGDGLALAASAQSGGYPANGIVLMFTHAPTGGTVEACEADVELQGDLGYNEGLGAALALADVNGDGLTDLVATALYSQLESPLPAMAHVYLAPLPASATSSEASAVVPLDHDASPQDSPAAWDDDGDGYAELWVPAAGWDKDRGALYRVAGPVVPGENTPVRAVEGVTEDSWAGRGLDAGDVDGDGVPDVLVGGAGHDDREGAAWLFLGPLAGTRTTDDAELTVDGVEAYSWLGYDAKITSDVTGDGVPDLLLGAPEDVYFGDGEPGRVWVIDGASRGTVTPVETRLEIAGRAFGEAFGIALAALDLDGDGLDEVLVGAPYTPLPESVGSLYRVEGRDVVDAIQDAQSDAATR